MTPHTDDTDDSRTVIITSHTQSRDIYHTDVCRNVWLIPEKRYVTEQYAREQMNLDECAYCTDDHDPSNYDVSYINALRNAAEDANAD